MSTNTQIKYFNMPELSDLFYMLNLAKSRDTDSIKAQYTGFEQEFNLVTTLLLGKDIESLFEVPEALPDRVQDILGHQLCEMAANRILPIIKESEKRYADSFALYMNMYNYGFIDGKRAERERRRIEV